MASDELLDVVVIGGSQAGLAMAWYLARQHLRFVVLEAGPEPGHTWRSRWDSLTLFTPAQHDALPGLYFLGLPWQHRRGSALLGFVHEDAAYLADRVTSRAPARPPAARLAAPPSASRLAPAGHAQQTPVAASPVALPAWG